MKTKIKFPVISVLLLLLFWPAAAFALPSGISNKIFSIAPHGNVSASADILRGSIAYEAAPEAVIEDAIDIENLSSQPVSVMLTAVDAKEDSQLKAPHEEKTNVGAWTSFLPDDYIVELAPRETRSVPVKIAVPADIPAGEYSGGIMAEETNSSAEKHAGQNVNVIAKVRLGMRIFIKINPLAAEPARLLKGTSPRFIEKLSLSSLLKEFSWWKKIAATLAAVYVFWFLLTHGLGYFKKHEKIKEFHGRHYKKIAGVKLTALTAFSAFVLFGVFGYASSGGVSISPAQKLDSNGNPIGKLETSFVINGSPGQTIEKELLVRNTFDSDVPVAIYVVDGEITSSGSLALGFTSDGEVPRWTSLSEGTVLLKSNESKKINVNFNIPSNASPGDYAGGLVVQKAQISDTSNANSGAIALTRSGVKIYLTVFGDAVLKSNFSGFALSKSAAGNYKVEFWTENQGNMKFRPETEFTLKKDGEVKNTFKEQSRAELTAGQNVKLSFDLPWKEAELESGSYEIAVKITGGSAPAEHAFQFTVSVLTKMNKGQKNIAIAVLAALAVIFALMVLLIVHKKRLRKKRALALAQEQQKQMLAAMQYQQYMTAQMMAQNPAAAAQAGKPNPNGAADANGGAAGAEING